MKSHGNALFVCALLVVAGCDEAGGDTADQEEMMEEATLPETEVECEPGTCAQGRLCVHPAPVCVDRGGEERGFEYPPDVCERVPSPCNALAGSELVDCLMAELCSVEFFDPSGPGGYDNGNVDCLTDATDCF